jgi:hypothetical protein
MKFDTKKLDQKKKNQNPVVVKEDPKVDNVAVTDDDSDFSLGTIAGMEDDTPKNRKASANTSTKVTTKESADMSTATEIKDKVLNAPKANVAVTSKNGAELESALAGTVSIKVHKNNAALVEMIVNKNDDVVVQDFETHFQANAKQIRITRQDAENALGKMDDGRWKILLMNRNGEVSQLNNYELVLGITEAVAEESKDLAQLNTRILAESKMEMDATRKLLGMTQAEFLEVAIKEYAEKVKAEMI